MCEDYEGYDSIREYQDGCLYYNGDRIDVKEYIKGNIVILDEDEDEEKEKSDFFDLEDFDKLL